MPRIYTESIDAAIKRVKLEEVSLKLTLLKEEVAQELKASEPQEYTPYDEIRPPNDEEMRAVQDRLNDSYNRIRAAHEEEYRDWLLSLADDWP